MILKINSLTSYNQIQSRLGVRFQNNKPMTKVPCQMKVSSNCREFNRKFDALTQELKKPWI